MEWICMILIKYNVSDKSFMHFLLPLDFEAVHEDAAFFGLGQDFLEVIMGHHLLFKILHYFSPLVPLVLVTAHYRVQQPLPSVLAHIHSKIH